MERDTLNPLISDFTFLFDCIEATPTPTPSITPTQGLSQTPTPTLTGTPVRTPTLTPTNTPTLTPTRTSTPTLTPTPTSTVTPSVSDPLDGAYYYISTDSYTVCYGSNPSDIIYGQNGLNVGQDTISCDLTSGLL